VRKDLADLTKQFETDTANYKTAIAKEKAAAARTLEEGKNAVKTLRCELNDMKNKAKKFATTAKKIKEQCKVCNICIIYIYIYIYIYQCIYIYHLCS
jgi:hypothetical protein